MKDASGFRLGARRCGPPLVTTAPSPDCRSIVVLPVRNEEGLVTRALASLACQTDRNYEIIVLLNNCTDGSQRAVENFIRKHSRVAIHAVSRELPPRRANIGHVRRLLMDEACMRLHKIGRGDGAILSTDADTVVPREWVHRNRKELAKGDAVGGRITIDPHEGRLLPPEVRRNYLMDIGYHLLSAHLEAILDPVPFDPWPRHHQHFAASLGVTAKAYRRAGGVPQVRHLEDVALWNALFVSGARLRHSPEIRVSTSARMDGRASAGLAAHLRGFTGRRDPQVESTAALIRRFLSRRHFREAWNCYRQNPFSKCTVNAGLNRAAELSGLQFEALRSTLEGQTNWAAALAACGIEAAAAHFGNDDRLEPLPRAVSGLRTTLRRLL